MEPGLILGEEVGAREVEAARVATVGALITSGAVEGGGDILALGAAVLWRPAVGPCLAVRGEPGARLKVTVAEAPSDPPAHVLIPSTVLLGIPGDNQRSVGRIG